MSLIVWMWCNLIDESNEKHVTLLASDEWEWNTRTFIWCFFFIFAQAIFAILNVPPCSINYSSFRYCVYFFFSTDIDCVSFPHINSYILYFAVSYTRYFIYFFSTVLLIHNLRSALIPRSNENNTQHFVEERKKIIENRFLYTLKAKGKVNILITGNENEYLLWSSSNSDKQKRNKTKLKKWFSCCYILELLYYILFLGICNEWRSGERSKIDFHYTLINFNQPSSNNVWRF